MTANQLQSPQAGGGLLPCPFCGNDGSGPIEDALQIHHNEPDYIHDHRHTWTVQCDKCTATMGYSDSEDEAIEAWNRRALAGEAVAKPLEWRYIPDAFPPVWITKTTIGSYHIEEAAGSDSPSFDLYNPMAGPMGNYEGLPEAKAAAQADYEFRIRSCLTTAAPLQADASAPASPAIGVQVVTGLSEETQCQLDAIDEAIRAGAMAGNMIVGSAPHPAPEAASAGGAGAVDEEQPEYLYFECPECQFSSVQNADFKGSSACPMCAGDSGHDVGMHRRTARVSDKPEGKDARVGFWDTPAKATSPTPSDTAPSPKGPAPVVGEAKSWTDAGLRTLQSALDLELLAEAISNCRWASIIPDKAAEQLKAAADFLASAPITAAPQEAQAVSEAPSPKGVSDGVRAESDIGGWKPIATAPRDGSLVWLWNKHAKHAVDSPQRFWWSTHYSVFGLGGCWTDGLATMGDKIDFDYWREELPANFINPYAALSQEPVPATAEERAASKEGA